jgi:hypothetical protein
MVKAMHFFSSFDETFQTCLCKANFGLIPHLVCQYEKRYLLTYIYGIGLSIQLSSEWSVRLQAFYFRHNHVTDRIWIESCCSNGSRIQFQLELESDTHDSF